MGNYTVPIPTISERATIFHIFTHTKPLQNVAEPLPLFYRWRTEVLRSKVVYWRAQGKTVHRREISTELPIYWSELWARWVIKTKKNSLWHLDHCRLMTDVSVHWSWESGLLLIRESQFYSASFIHLKKPKTNQTKIPKIKNPSFAWCFPQKEKNYSKPTIHWLRWPNRCWKQGYSVTWNLSH